MRWRLEGNGGDERSGAGEGATDLEGCSAALRAAKETVSCRLEFGRGKGAARTVGWALAAPVLPVAVPLMLDAPAAALDETWLATLEMLDWVSDGALLSDSEIELTTDETALETDEGTSDVEVWASEAAAR